jgi:hypothetical protein
MDNKYINLAEAINIIRTNGLYGSGYSNEEREDDVINMLESLPVTTIRTNPREKVCGYWAKDYETFVNDNGYESEPIQTGWSCSVCHESSSYASNYCPNCGAKMNNNEE